MSKDKYRCMYAEDLRGKRVTLTIERFRDAPKPLYCNGQKSGAWDIIFKERDKLDRTMYIQIPKEDDDGKRATISRQFTKAVGCEPSDEIIGKKITLYPVDSKKAPTGVALRIAVD